MNTAALPGNAAAPPLASPSPFHEGEQHLQTLTGRREKMEALGRTVIRGFMPDQHREFFAQLPFIIVGGLDEARQPWATVWAGPPGFMHSPDPEQLHIVAPRPCAGDPLEAAWHRAGPGQGTCGMPDMPIGLLGIQPHTRRRNRLNGTLREVGDAGWAVQVRQSFGNCPKYIVPREVAWHPQAAGPARIEQGRGLLPPHVRDHIARADTFFLASASPGAGLPGKQRSDGVDVSHRGGTPGFVHIDTDAAHTLVIPDYSGNFMFNTLGNILLQPRIGLLFIDMAHGDVLWLAATGTLDLDSPRIAAFEGAQRLLHARIDRWVLARRALPLVCTPAAP